MDNFEIRKLALDAALQAKDKINMYSAQDFVREAMVFESYLLGRRKEKTKEDDTERTEKIIAQKTLQSCIENPCTFMSKGFIQHPTRGPVTPYITHSEQWLTYIEKYDRLIINADRQLGLTTTLAFYVLWSAMYKLDQTILVCCHRLENALEFMDKVRYIYEQLPDYLRAKLTIHNKARITFENGSTIISRAMTPDTCRGLSASLVVIEQAVFVSWSVMEDFWHGIMPTLHNSKVVLTNTLSPTEMTEGAGGVLKEGSFVKKLMDSGNFVCSSYVENKNLND